MNSQDRGLVSLFSAKKIGVLLAAAVFLTGGFFVTAPPTQAVVSLGLVLNEVYVDGTSEWVEILNPNADGDSIDLFGYKIVQGAADVKVVTVHKTVPPLGLAVLNDGDFSGALIFNDTEDSITFLDPADAGLGNVSYGGINPLLAPGAGESLSFISVNWSVQSATKGWFNDAGTGEMTAPLLGTIDVAITAGGIATNIGEMTDPSATPNTEAGGALYFEKVGLGKIVFEKTLNLTDQATVAVLQNLGAAMEMSAGHIEFDSATALAMNTTGAKIYMSGLDALGYDSAPNLIVKDDVGVIISPDDLINYPTITVIGYAAGTFTFTTDHFTQFDVDSNIYVDGSNTGDEFGTQANPYSSIQDAIDAAPIGATVHVAAGTYTEQITINKSLDLIGADGEAMTIIKAPAVREKSETQGTTIHDYVLAAFANEGTIDVRVEGFTIDADAQEFTAGTDRIDGVFFRDVKDMGGSDAGLFSSTIHNFSATEYKAWGVAVYGDSLLTIDGDDISDYTRDGILVIGGNITISNNTITGSATPLNGINIQNVITGSVTGNTVTNNTRSAPWAAGGIVLWTSTGVTISNNNVNGNFYGIDLEDGSDGVTISGNTLTENIKRNITLNASDNCTVSGNTITGTIDGTEDVGIALVNTSTGNTIGGDTAESANNITLPMDGAGNLYAIHVQGDVGAGSNTIKFNTITGAKRGIQVDGGNTGLTTISSNTISNNGVDNADPSHPKYGIGINGGNVTIADNTLTNTIRPIEFWGPINVAITGNTIDGATNDAINAGSASGTVDISGNTIYNVTADNLYAIHLRADIDGATIDDNEIYDSYIGIFVDTGSTGLQITNNNIHDTTWGAINLHEAVSTITGNTLTDNQRGIETDHSITAQNNSFLGDPADDYCQVCLYAGATYDISHNWWGTAVPATIASWVGDNGNAYSYTPYYVDSLRTILSTTAPITVYVDSTYAEGSAGGNTFGYDAFTTIQEGVDAVAAGGAVNVAAGTYDEQIIIDNKNITLDGVGDETLIMPSSPDVLVANYTYPEGVQSGWAGVKLASPIIVTNSSSVTVKDLKVDGINVSSLPAGASRLSGILFGEAGGLISNVTVNNIKTDGYTVRTYSIDVSSVTVPLSIEVADSRVNDFARTAIQAQGANLAANIHDNVIVGPGFIGPANVPNGIVLIAGATGDIIENTVSGNHYTGESYLASGIMLYQSGDGVEISGNEVFDVDDAVLIAGANGATVSTNNLHGNVKGVQIEQSGATNSVITDNTISDNTYGIYLADSAGAGNAASENLITGSVTLAVNNLSLNNLNAINNWWGVASPDFGAILVGDVTYEPWYVNAAKTLTSVDQAAADVVITQIAALPAVADLALPGTEVFDAKSAYTALTDGQQTLVTNLAVLTAAEAQITALENATADVDALESAVLLDLTDKFNLTDAEAKADTANTSIGLAADGGAKTDLIARYDTANAVVKLARATAAVVTAETSELQADVNTAQALVTALPDGADKTALQDRIDAVQVIIDARVEAAAQAAAELAVAAYESAAITTLDEITIAEGLEADANTAITAVNDITAHDAFALRMSERKVIVDAAKTALLEAAAVNEINAATVDTMNAAIVANAATLDLDLTDYNELSNNTSVHVALTGKAFANKGAVKTAFDSAVATQKTAEAIKAITAFSFPGIGVGVIDGVNISVNVPFGTDVTNLVATFTTTGARVAVGEEVQTSGASINNFSLSVTYIVTAVDRTVQEYIVTVTILAEQQTAPDENGDATADETTPEVVITDPDKPVIITVADGTDAEIDVSEFIAGGTGIIPQITINSDDADIEIPDATTVTSDDPTWNGVIAAPTVTTVTLPDEAGQTETLGAAIEVGFTGAKLSFSKAVRLLLPGQAGKRAGYTRDGGVTFTEITNICAADNQATGDLLPADGDCKIDVGADLAIWTKHFTAFATYTSSATPASTSPGSGGGSPLPASNAYANWLAQSGQSVAPAATSNVETPGQVLGEQTFADGALIRVRGTLDVFIVKYVGDKKFKRLILNPSVFNSYKHLRWSDILDVEQSVVDSFMTSDLVRVAGETRVYKLVPSGDTGAKHWIRTAAAFNNRHFEWNAIYEINSVDRDSYVTGENLE